MSKEKLYWLMVCVIMVVTGLVFCSYRGTAMAPQASYSAVAAGENHSVALSSDGRLLVWGNNYSGQLGLVGSKSVKTPEPLGTPTNVISVATGSDYTMAIQADGTLWAWGDNSYGQLGDGTTNTSTVPKKVPGIANVTTVALGATHAVALTDDGSVWAWGRNLYGQVGDGTDTKMRTTPVRVTGLPRVASIAAGGRHTLALDADGYVWVWGDNDSGQLGIGRKSESHSPVPVPGLEKVVAVAAGAYHSVAVEQNGSVWVWGNNEYSQLGNGVTTSSNTPIRLVALSSVKAVAAGTYHTLFLKYDGTLWVCGYNSSGQLGIDAREAVTTPVRIDGLEDITAISAGKTHAMALKQDGSVWVWGNNNDYQLGLPKVDNTWQPKQVLPVAPPGMVTSVPQQAVAVEVVSQPIADVVPTTTETPEEAPIAPKITLASTAGEGTVEGNKLVYAGRGIFEATALEWAALSPDEKLVAYKVDREIRLYNVADKTTKLLYKMTMDEYAGKWVYNYGFLPEYWYKFVGWSIDGTFFVVDKDYPGLFKGGTGYYRVDVNTGEMSHLDEDDIAHQ